jgi:O-antigen ligase
MFASGLGLALLWVVKLLRDSETTFKRSPMHWPVLGFVAYTFVRYFNSELEYEARRELLYVVVYGLVYFAAVCNFGSARDRRVLLWTLMILALVQAAYGIWQFAGKTDRVFSWDRTIQFHGRASGTYICPNSLAGFLEITMALLLGQMVFFNRRERSMERSVVQKLSLIYVLLVAGVALVLTLSRAGWFSTLAGLGVFLLLWSRLGRFQWKQWVGGAVLLAVILGVALALEPVRHYVLRSFTATPDRASVGLRDKGLGDRVSMWRGTVAMIQERPMLGSGPGSWQYFFLKHKDETIGTDPEDAHNDYLQLASDYGVIGFLLVAWAFVAFFWHARLHLAAGSPPEHRAFALGGMTGVSMILVHSWFDFNMHIPGNALLLITVMAFTVAMEDPGGRHPSSILTGRQRGGLAAALLAVSLASVWYLGRASLAVHYGAQGSAYKKANVFKRERTISAYERASSLDPGFPKPYAKRADVYRAEAQWLQGTNNQARRAELANKAIDYYTESLARNRYQTEVRIRRGKAYELLGDTTNALKNFERAVRGDTNNPFALLTLGYAYRDVGETNKALQLLNKVASMGFGGYGPVQLNEIDIMFPDAKWPEYKPDTNAPPHEASPPQ